MKFASKLFNKLKYLTMIVLATTVVSCDSWLDLGSEDRIMENTLFSSQAIPQCQVCEDFPTSTRR